MHNDSPDEFVVLYHCGYSDSNAVFKAAYNYLGAAGITCETFSLVVLPKKMTMTAVLAPVGSFVSTVLNSKWAPSNTKSKQGARLSVDGLLSNMTKGATCAAEYATARKAPQNK